MCVSVCVGNDYVGSAAWWNTDNNRQTIIISIYLIFTSMIVQSLSVLHYGADPT